MRILILGFGGLAREVLDRIKHFPEYGEDREIAASHIHVNRNSLSYGPDYVVEIPDPQGDGYRTYNDGFQAIDSFSTTVSDYEDHILGEVENGMFSVIVDCTNKTQSSRELLAKLQKAADDQVSFVLANELETVDAVVDELRYLFDGGKPWEPVEYTSTFIAHAADEWEKAKTKMQELHLMKRTEFCTKYSEGLGRTSREYVIMSKLIPQVDQDTIQRFIANDSHYPIKYQKNELYLETNKCLVVRHEMLDWFYGSHSTEGPACQVHCNPRLKAVSAKYVEYDTDHGIPLPEEDYEYAVEYVVKGPLMLRGPNGDTTEVPSSTAYAYRPKINPPLRKVFNGLSSMIFYYKEL